MIKLDKLDKLDDHKYSPLRCLKKRCPGAYNLTLHNFPMTKNVLY